MKKEDQGVKTFLICHRGALGDFILTWPALHGLRGVLPGYTFLGIGRSENMRLAMSLGLLDRCLDMESARMLDFFCGQAVPAEMGSPHGAVLWLSEGQGAADLLKTCASLPVLVVQPFPGKPVHVALHHYSALQSHFPIDIPQHLSPSFPFPGVKRSRYAVIHPGSGSLSKNYPLPFYLAVSRELRQSGYPEVRFILGPAEEKLEAKDFDGELVERPEHMESLARVLAGAILYVGNDSGVSHLSGILGTPTIAFYRKTDPAVWGVLGTQVAHISAVDEKSALAQLKEHVKQWNYPMISFHQQGGISSCHTII